MQIKLREIFNRWSPLFLISCLSLFMELAVIRWISGEIRLFAYFKNLTLLAAFLGLAIGFALVGKGKDYRSVFPWLWGLFTILVLVFGYTTKFKALVYPGGGDEFLWFTADLSFWLSLLIFIGIIILFFFMILFIFIPLGQATGVEMADHAPVPAYITNILASLVGVWLFSLVSYLQTPPVVWFSLALIGIAIYFVIKHSFNWIVGSIFLVTIIGIGINEPNTIWSPYNRLDIMKTEFGEGNNTLPLGYSLTVQHYSFEGAYDLSEGFIKQVNKLLPEKSRVIEDLASQYNLPFILVPTGSRVLVVGSGMGNDVAAALRAQAGFVEAVEIDPAILQLGQELHPEKPYSDPRVFTVVDDARSYFNRSQEKYDLIVFGLLDSHTLLSSLSSVRLDSFVYTVESFRQAKERLNPDGYMTVAFVTNPWIKERLGRMLEEVFGKDKVYYNYRENGTIFVTGDNPPNSKTMEQLSKWSENSDISDLPVATDDWPYIYLRALRIPAGLWQTLLVIILLSIALMARSFPEALKPNIHFWLLGAAFLLIEFKSITELALLFGTTWFVNSLAISGVLVMALLANLYILRKKQVNLRWVYTFLFISMLFGYFFPLAQLAKYGPMIKGIIGTTVLSLPLFFAGMIFSESLRRYGETSRPIASNFSGSAVGGLLEYCSIWWGIKGLYLIAILLYFGALIAALKQRLLSR